jgi:pilus assembly protein CpaE
MSRRRLGNNVTLDPQRIAQLVHGCRSAYAWSVIDASRIPLDVASELERQSHVTIVPLQLMIKDIQVARQMLNGLADRGANMDRVFVIAMRYRRRGLAITLDEAKQTLGLKGSQILSTLSNDFAAVTDAVNLGKPLSQTAPRSDYRREVQKLAGTIAGLKQVVAISRSGNTLVAV